MCRTHSVITLEETMFSADRTVERLTSVEFQLAGGEGDENAAR